MNFYRRPFTYVTSLFIGGVVAVKFFPIDNFSILFACLLSIVVAGFFFVKLLKKEVFSSWCLIPFFFLGALSFNNSTPEINQLQPSRYGLIINVDEIEEEAEGWRKSLCTIVGRVDSLKLEKHNERVLLYVLETTVQAGDQLFVYTELDVIDNRGNPGEFDAETYWNNQGVYRSGFVSENEIVRLGYLEVNWLRKFPKTCRAYLSNVLGDYLKGESLALARALVLGDKQLLTTKIKSSFSNSGAMHVLAVSGLHVGIILMIIQFVFGQFTWLISKRVSVVISILIIWGYAAITEFSPSVIRASFMFSMLSLSKVYSKQSDSINVLFFTAFLLLLIQPSLIFNIGFQLSYLAMFGIYSLYDPIWKLMYFKYKLLNWVWKGTAIGISAQLLTAPLTLYYFHQFPNYFALTNLGIMVLAGVILSLALFLFLVHLFGVLSNVIGILLGVCFGVLLWFVQFVESIPGAVATGFTLSSFIVLIIYFSLILLFVFRNNKQIVYLSGVLLLVLFTSIQYTRHENLSSNEVVLFNSKQFTSVVKVGNQAVCFYVSNQKRPGHLSYMLEGYSKVRPASMSYHRVKLGVTTMSLGIHRFKIKRFEDGIIFSFKEKTVAVRFRASFPVQENWKVVDMPYLVMNDYGEPLSQGAIAFSI